MLLPPGLSFFALLALLPGNAVRLLLSCQSKGVKKLHRSGVPSRLFYAVLSLGQSIGHGPRRHERIGVIGAHDPARIDDARRVVSHHVVRMLIEHAA
jgi:hypothetical protein